MIAARRTALDAAIPSLAEHRGDIRALHVASQDQVLERLLTTAPSAEVRARAVTRAAALVRAIRGDDRPGLMEVFLAEYGLSTREGVALMCLAEALLRVPDAPTMDALIEDKIAPSAWGAHLGKSSSSLVNASTWALMLTGKVLQDGEGMASVLHGAMRRLGEPVIRTAVGRAMREMGAQFVLGETIEAALARGAGARAKGYGYSYDMLGEAAMTQADADVFRASYMAAIAELAKTAKASDQRDNPGISIKLSALHPRYEESQSARVMEELVPRVLTLAHAAKRANMGLNIDAEEADRLDLSLDVIEAVLRDPELADWDGFGVVVQAYGKRASAVLDWLYALAVHLDRRIMVRLVKGAYWDTEIKRAQVEGLSGFPVFTVKQATDISYQCCAAQLLGMTDRIYPQFATHNAQTVAAILELAGAERDSFEFQRLHGMGASLFDKVLKAEGVRVRIYAPVGAHRDLLAYLVRRLLENGANSSFVNQIVDEAVSPEIVAADPFAWLETRAQNTAVLAPCDLFAPSRANAKGWDLRDRADLASVEQARAPWRNAKWQAAPRLAIASAEGGSLRVLNPADPRDIVGQVALIPSAQVAEAFEAARVWDAPVAERASILIRAADLMEENFGQIFALLAREAGKTLPDCVAELREAVDFLRYYAEQAQSLNTPARGVFACISPWNFPLAIFTGQIAAALAAGNAVLAKPAETTLLTADLAVSLLHQAGVPVQTLQLLPGHGADVGAALSALPGLAGVCFTGSTTTAQRINRAMAQAAAPDAPLIAETGGLNAMIVDSTALPEQAVRDIVQSAFQSAGQRCSALRMLYVQRDVADTVLTMLQGAMAEVRLGNPWDFATDIGPVISAQAQAEIDEYITKARGEGRLIQRGAIPAQGNFVAPTVLRVTGIADLTHEVFGPVLHVATFEARDLDHVIDAVNASGYGLTFGIHSRIDDRIARVVERVKCGNIYVNRNQIGAIVGSQPFGGEGQSGTGPKAGGPEYLPRFARTTVRAAPSAPAEGASVQEVQARLTEARARKTSARLWTRAMPGPTGESNRLSGFGRGVALCLGPSAGDAAAQARMAEGAGCVAVQVAPGALGALGVDGRLEAQALSTLDGVDVVLSWSGEETLRAQRQALAARDGAIVPLIADADPGPRCQVERHVCVDTTASGGNVGLLAASAKAVAS